MNYRADIDGLRALAVLPVVFYHAGFELFAGGFVGVDVFFVISGYLITALIFTEISQGSFTFRGFYLRRVRRLFPALFAMVLFSCLPAYFLLLPDELEDFGQSVASQAVFASNILFWSEADYFAPAAELKPLLHTWSLAIEEQYYLLFPALLLLLKRIPGKPFLAVTGMLFAGSLLLSATTVYTSPEAAFYLLPSRTWELLLGSLIAMSAFTVRTRWVCEGLAAAGLLMIAVAVFSYDAGVAFPGLAALLPCLGTALLIVAGAEHKPLVTRVLSEPRLVFVGLISYSLYLWHWPILVYAKHFLVGEPSTVAATGLVALAFIVSVLSWRYIERPFRGKQGLLQSKQLFQTAGAVMVLLITVGLWFDQSKGLPKRLPEPVADILVVAEQRPTDNRRCEGIVPTEMGIDRLCRFGAASPTPASVLLWGDSHAHVLVPALEYAAQQAGAAGVYAVANGCAPLARAERTVQRGQISCKAFNEAVVTMLAAETQLDTVVLAARWGYHASGRPHLGEDATVFLRSDTNTATDAAQNLILFEQGFLDLIGQVRALGRNVIVIESVPEASADVPASMAKSRWRKRNVELAVPLSEFEARQAGFAAALAAAKSAYPEIASVSLSRQLCDATRCVTEAQGQPLYFDDNHLSRAGITRLTPLFADLLNGE